MSREWQGVECRYCRLDVELPTDDPTECPECGRHMTPTNPPRRGWWPFIGGL